MGIGIDVSIKNSFKIYYITYSMPPKPPPTQNAPVLSRIPDAN